MSIFLPNFLCIGAPKAGTTSLYDAFKLHPQICVSTFKEPRFFNEHYEKGLQWYSRAYFRPREGVQAIGEFTPNYLANATSAQRIRDSLGSSVKFIVILRNPVERAYSHFLHAQSEGVECRSFEDAVAAEVADWDRGIVAFDKYLWPGLYGRHLKQYFEIFPRENFFIVSFERGLVKEFNTTVHNLWKFIGVEPIELPTVIRSNAYRAPPRSMMWIKQAVNGNGFPKKVLKGLIPVPMRQQWRGVFNEFLDRPAQKPAMSSQSKVQLLERHFSKDLAQLSSIVGSQVVNEICGRW